jgi:hypothetical protein
MPHVSGAVSPETCVSLHDSGASSPESWVSYNYSTLISNMCSLAFCKNIKQFQQLKGIAIVKEAIFVRLVLPLFDIFVNQ